MKIVEKLSENYYNNNLDIYQYHDKLIQEFESWVIEASKTYRGFWCHDYDLLDLAISVDTLREQGLEVKSVKRRVTSARYEDIEADCYEVRWVLGRSREPYLDLCQLCSTDIKMRVDATES